MTMDAEMLLVPGLVTVHVVLAALVRFQYHQDHQVDLKTVLWDALPAIPVLTFVVRWLHPLNGRTRQGLALVASMAIGCWLVWASNELGYFAGMRPAPALGTLWTWLFIEMEWYNGAVSFFAVLVYTYMNGYRF